MWQVTKRVEVAGAHSLRLPYNSICKNPHGHNWIITVTVCANTLTDYGMVIDFSIIKEIVKQLDHVNVNDVLDGTNPTAENIAHWVAHHIEERAKELDKNAGRKRVINVSKVEVQESEGNVACYIP